MDIEKACSRCGERKRIAEFAVRDALRGTRRPYCRACKAVYQHDWYQRNRERHKGAVAAYKLRLRRHNAAIVRAAKEIPCSDCGGEFPTFVMDFDHVRGGKVANVSAMLAEPTERLRMEIAKCEVVCANCHRIRSFGALRSREDNAFPG